MDEQPEEVRLQQACAYAALLKIAEDERCPFPSRIAAARSVLQFSTPGYFDPPEMVEDSSDA